VGHRKNGLTENAGRENDGPICRRSVTTVNCALEEHLLTYLLTYMKLQVMKMTDQIAGHEIARHEITRQEIAGHENDGPKMTTGRDMAAEKSTVSTEIALQ